MRNNFYRAIIFTLLIEAIISNITFFAPHAEAADLSRNDAVELAEKGDPDGQFALGNMYYEGSHGFIKNIRQAEYWYKKAAEQGHQDAQRMVMKLETEQAKQAMMESRAKLYQQIQAAQEAQEQAETENLINTVRNNMYYADYPADLGYLSFGQQLEKFFKNGEWSIENNKELEKNFGSLAVFKGIGRYIDKYWGFSRYNSGGRRTRVTVRIGRAKRDLTSTIKEGNFVVVSIHENNNRLYYYEYDKEIYRGDMQSQMALDMVGEIFGGIGVKVDNDLKLSDFLSTIYYD